MLNRHLPSKLIKTLYSSVISHHFAPIWNASFVWSHRGLATPCREQPTASCSSCSLSRSAHASAPRSAPAPNVEQRRSARTGCYRSRTRPPGERKTALNEAAPTVETLFCAMRRWRQSKEADMKGGGVLYFTSSPHYTKCSCDGLFRFCRSMHFCVMCLHCGWWGVAAWFYIIYTQSIICIYCPVGHMGKVFFFVLVWFFSLGWCVLMISLPLSKESEGGLKELCLPCTVLRLTLWRIFVVVCFSSIRVLWIWGETFFGPVMLRTTEKKEKLCRFRSQLYCNFLCFSFLYHQQVWPEALNTLLLKQRQEQCIYSHLKSCALY